jgi:hypothetical protein
MVRIPPRPLPSRSAASERVSDRGADLRRNRSVLVGADVNVRQRGPARAVPAFRSPRCSPGREGITRAGPDELYLMCEDVRATIEELRANGAEVTRRISDEGFGLMTALRLPGGSEIALYEPRHPSPSPGRAELPLPAPVDEAQRRSNSPTAVRRSSFGRATSATSRRVRAPRGRSPNGSRSSWPSPLSPASLAYFAQGSSQHEDCE